MRAARDQLVEGSAGLGVELSPLQLDQLLGYLNLIQKWNKVYNLTAVRNPAEMVTHHLLDSLAVVAPLRRQLDVMGVDGSAQLLDVGSGAGLPGVVIAICLPQLVVHCVDTVAKKAAFLNQVAVTLRLDNLRSVHARVENLTGQYDVISSRAFASLADFTAWSGAALKKGGTWLAMKGQHPQEEIRALEPGIEVFHVEQLTVPGLAAQRCIVWMRQAQCRALTDVQAATMP